MVDFVIAHISDLHITSRVDSNTWDADSIFGLGDWFREHADDLDALVISGDLADTALSKNLRTAKEILTGSMTLPGLLPNSTMVEILPPDVLTCVVPGNHDRLHGPKNIFCGSTNFENVFGKSWDFNRGEQEIAASTNTDGDNYVRTLFCEKNGHGVAFCVVDFSLKKSLDAVPHFGKGKVYDERLDSLELETDRLRNSHPSVCIIWVVHFSPSDSVNWVLQLDYREKFSAAAERMGIQVVLAGHTHEPCVERNLANSKGSPALLVSGSVSKGRKYSTHDKLFSGRRPHSFFEIHLDFSGGYIHHAEVKRFDWTFDLSVSSAYSFSERMPSQALTWP